jgi:hypothetical protein
MVTTVAGIPIVTTSNDTAPTASAHLGRRLRSGSIRQSKSKNSAFGTNTNTPITKSRTPENFSLLVDCMLDDGYGIEFTLIQVPFNKFGGAINVYLTPGSTPRYC